VTAADAPPGRLGPGALAVVVDELARLPWVDERFRLWPWSLRATAQRRRCSPGTVHKHHQALSATGVLVTDDRGRTLVDTARLDEARAAGGPPATCRPRRRSTGSPHGQRSDHPPVAAGEADVLVAIEALTAAVEARPGLAGVLTSIIGRLARVLEDVPPAMGAVPARPRPAPQARDQASGARGRHRGECGSEQGRCASTAGAGARRGARDRAPSKKERKTQDSLFDSARDSDLPGLSFSRDNERRANEGARPGRAPEGRAGARSAERLLELLGPLDPARHVTYIEGVQAALAGYDDAQVTRAVTRLVVLDKATINPVGLLVDRAHANDPLYFPATSPEANGRVAEPPAELWSVDPSREPTGPTPAEQSMETLPGLEPDPTLAPALAARAALDAAHQPVTRQQLAARQAELPDDGEPDLRLPGPDGGSGLVRRSPTFRRVAKAWRGICRSCP
jgi:hypothetical protein